jgi:hypothetical protein
MVDVSPNGAPVLANANNVDRERFSRQPMT